MFAHDVLFYAGICQNLQWILSKICGRLEPLQVIQK